MQFWCCPGVGHLHPIFKPRRGAFAALIFQHKMTDARGNGHAFNLLSHKSVKYPGFPKFGKFVACAKSWGFYFAEGR